MYTRTKTDYMTIIVQEQKLEYMTIIVYKNKS